MRSFLVPRCSSLAQSQFFPMPKMLISSTKNGFVFFCLEGVLENAEENKLEEKFLYSFISVKDGPEKRTETRQR